MSWDRSNHRHDLLRRLQDRSAWQEWEREFGLSLELDDFSQWIQKDVNSVTYEATVKNDSGYTFDYVQFEILEKDKDGNTINTTWASVENWDNDTERTFEFYPDDGTEDYVIDSEECELK